MLGTANVEPKYDTATLAGGCFWGMEHYFRKEFGNKLKNIKVGYIGGSLKDPIYTQVKKGFTGHAEAIQFQFNPDEVSYQELVTYFWRVHDPTTKDRQDIDIGPQYRSVLFYHHPSQLNIAQSVLPTVQPNYPDPILTDFVDARPLTFYLAEEYHQSYLIKNSAGECTHYLRW